MTSIFNNFTTPPQNQVNVQQTNNNQQLTVKDAIPASTVSSDTVEISKEKKQKKGPIKATKEFIANVKKFFTTFGEYTKGTFKGLVSGVTSGSVIYTAGSVINWGIEKAAKKSGNQAKKIPNKFLAGAVAVGTLAKNIWDASLNATQKQSEIDMRWTGVEPKK